MKNTARTMPKAPLSALEALPIPQGITSELRMEGDVVQLLTRVNQAVGDLKADMTQRQDKADQKADRALSRVTDLEQRLAQRRGGSSSEASLSWGETVAQSDAYREFVAASCKGSQSISVQGALTSVSTSGGALVRPDRSADGVMLPRRRMTIRALLGEGTTGTNLVEYFKEKTFVNNAGMVAETTEKPQSEITYELANAPVRTIAHWIPASRQLMDDAPQLATLIDSSLRYGLAFKEEQQLLFGDGQGENLHGMMPQATAFDVDGVNLSALGGSAYSKYTRLDALRDAVGQAASSDLPASGIILNTRDYFDLFGIKDAGGNYVMALNITDPWGLPIVYTSAMPRGQFLVGAFETATTIYDRMLPEVLISSEDRDNFIKNMLTVRGESRLAFAVRRPAALIKGDFNTILTALNEE